MDNKLENTLNILKRLESPYKALGFLAKGEKLGSEFRNHLDNFQLAGLFIAESIAAKQGNMHYTTIYYAKNKVIQYGIAQDRFNSKSNRDDSTHLEKK